MRPLNILRALGCRISLELLFFLAPRFTGVVLYRRRARAPWRTIESEALSRLALDPVRLRKSWVLIAGAGGLAGLPETLVRAGVNVVLCDADGLHPSNLVRGRHSRRGLRSGANKAVLLARKLAHASISGAEIVAVPSTVEAFLGSRHGKSMKFDVIVAAVDDDDVRSAVQRHAREQRDAREQRVPFVTCGISHDPPYAAGYSFVYLADGRSACFECLRASLPTPPAPKAKCDDPNSGALLHPAIVELTAGEAALHVMQLLSGGDPPPFRLVHTGDGGGRTRAFIGEQPGCGCMQAEIPEAPSSAAPTSTPEAQASGDEDPPKSRTWAPL